MRARAVTFLTIMFLMLTPSVYADEAAVSFGRSVVVSPAQSWGEGFLRFVDEILRVGRELKAGGSPSVELVNTGILSSFPFGRRVILDVSGFEVTSWGSLEFQVRIRGFPRPGGLPIEREIRFSEPIPEDGMHGARELWASRLQVEIYQALEREKFFVRFGVTGWRGLFLAGVATLSGVAAGVSGAWYFLEGRSCEHVLDDGPPPLQKDVEVSGGER